MMSRLFCAALTAVLSLAAAPVHQAREKHLFVDVQVVEPLRDRVMDGLRQNDFEIFDDGRPAEITSFVAGYVPLDLVIIEPATDTACLNGIGAMVEDLSPALQELRPADRLAIIRASRKGELLFGLSADFERARKIMLQGRSKPRKNDCFYDAVVLAAEVLAVPGSGLRRRAIVIIGDDRELGSMQTQAEATQAAMKAGATVNVLLLPTEAGANATPTPMAGYPPRPIPLSTFPPWSARGQTWKSVKPLVIETGGEFRMPITRKGRLTELIRRLNARYFLGFAPVQSRESQRHRLSFAVRGVIGAEVSARKAY